MGLIDYPLNAIAGALRSVSLSIVIAFSAFGADLLTGTWLAARGVWILGTTFIDLLGYVLILAPFHAWGLPALVIFFLATFLIVRIDSVKWKLILLFPIFGIAFLHAFTSVRCMLR